MERPSKHIKEAINLTRCFYELGAMAVDQTIRRVGDSIDAAWPEDDEEDRDIHSDVWTRSEAA